jgi:fructose-specific phosphotransferase system IIC component
VRAADQAPGSPETVRRQKRAVLIVQLGLVLFLLLSAALLAYETLALASSGRFAPITYYVRCTSRIAHPAAYAGATIVSFLAGHWFWYPRRPR